MNELQKLQEENARLRAERASFDAERSSLRVELQQRSVALQQTSQTVQQLTRRLEHQALELREQTARREQSEAMHQQLSHQQLAMSEKDVLLAEQSETIRRQEEKQQLLQPEINRLVHLLFGGRSERYLGEPRQLAFDFGDTPAAQDAADGLQQAVDERQQADEEAETITVPEHQRKREKKKRDESLPEHLTRIETIADVDPDQKHCDAHGDKVLMGYDIREKLVSIPSRLEIHVTKYPKYACPNHAECGIAQAPRPEGLVEGDKYDSSVAAEIIANKYGFHLPLYRQQDMFARCGWTPHRSTLLNILTAAADRLKPFVRYLADEVRKDPVIGTDDTGVTLLLPKLLPQLDPDNPRSVRAHEVLSKAMEADRKSVLAHMWVYRGFSVPLNVFDFTVSRHRDGPDQFLVDASYTGTLVGDCYGGYTKISMRCSDRIMHAACNIHARRKVLEASETCPVVASEILACYQALSDIETRGAVMDAAARLELRQTEAVAVWKRMTDYLDSPAVASLKPKEVMAKAINYIRNNLTALQVYLNDPAVPIDNNLSEQLMRHVATGRNNWMFSGSIIGGERAADLLTIVCSAHRNDLDVTAYVQGVLDAMLSGSTDYFSLRPDIWAAAHPEQIRIYRQEERRDRADRKQRRRALHREHLRTSAKR